MARTPIPAGAVRSRKTTIAAVAAAVAIIAGAVADALANGWDATDVSLIAGAVAIAAQGFFSRDDDVSSEGEKVARPRAPR